MAAHAPWPVRALWFGLGGLVLAQVGYPLTHATARAALVIGTVSLGYLLSVAHALLTRGLRTATILVAVTTAGGFAVESVGVTAGIPFGGYGYGDALGPKLAGVPLVIPLAWTWMAWPAWLAAGRLVTARPPSRRSVAARIMLAGWGLAAWDLFLDPQMVAEGYWHWVDPVPVLPGIPSVPAGNFLGWLVVATAMMALLAAGTRPGRTPASGRATPAGPDPATGPARTNRAARATDQAGGADAPMIALYLWTYGSSVLAGLAFLHLPGASGWVALGMAPLAVPLAVRLGRAARHGTPGGRGAVTTARRPWGTG